MGDDTLGINPVLPGRESVAVSGQKSHAGGGEKPPLPARAAAGCSPVPPCPRSQRAPRTALLAEGLPTELPT